MDKGSYRELIDSGNLAIADAAMKCEAVFSSHRRAIVSISGGADSDIMLDICERVRQVAPIEIHYLFFDTGLEYRATLRHLDYIRERYGVNVERMRAYKSIPIACMENGQPFLSKHVSTNCDLLQRRGFQWEDEPYEVLVERYDRCTTALKWWCNKWTRVEGSAGWFDIGRIRWLKEFMVANPPKFRISAKCCQLAKKQTSINAEREREADLVVHGVRKAEGGVRASHNRCYDRGSHGTDTYRPLFWFNGDDKRFYDERFRVAHSDCYTVWGFKRTGCSCCPFGRELEYELATIRHFEPTMARACEKVFKDSYEYTRQFHAFREEMGIRKAGQMRLDISGLQPNRDRKIGL